MSTRTDSTKKPNALNENLYDSYHSIPSGEITSNVPWPEWNDAELNSEIWDGAKGRPASAKLIVPEVGQSLFFEDPNPPMLPVVIREYVSSWRRPHEVFASNLTVYDNSNGKLALSVPSPVADCNFFHDFDETLPIFQLYAEKNGFRVESDSADFVPTTQKETWKPWHHVYALCKAGKGQVHKPAYSPFGKYVLRLYYFGSWRKFVVDDRIPCDKYGLCMLPVTRVEGELWPILLAKGLLKIVSVTSSEMDFPLVSCLAGLVRLKLTVGNKTHDQIWRRMRVLTRRHEIVEEESRTRRESTPSKRGTVKDSKRGSSKNDSGWERESSAEQSCLLLANLGGFNPEETDLNGVAVAVVANRDSPLVKASRRDSTKPWKRLRWVYWASKKGIWTDETLLPPYRRLQYVTTAKELVKVLAPDPKQEATLYALPEADDSADAEEDPANWEPVHWSDFYKFSEYLMKLDAFLKPSWFRSKFKMTCLKRSELAKKDAMATASKSAKTAKTAKSVEPENYYYYSPVLSPTLNQPAILYCESLSGIFICFSLWVCPSGRKSSVGYLDPQQPEMLKIGHATLVIERYDWRTVQQGELLGVAKSVGNSSCFVNLKPGRHVMKLWLDSDSPYAVDVYSNVDLSIDKGPKIRFLMKTESERILAYVANVSNSFVGLAQKFGKPELPVALKDFYEAVKPGNDGVSLYRSKLDAFIETFLDCVVAALKSLIANEDELRLTLAALRCLFINPNIRCDLSPGRQGSIYGGQTKKTVKKVEVESRTLSDVLNHPWTSDEIRGIVTIQRIFRGHRVRLLSICQNPARREFKPYGERLKKVCDLIFAPSKREAEVGKIVRMVFMANQSLLTTYRFHDDFPKTIETEEFAGKVPGVEARAWVPLARFVVACHCSELVPCAFHFACNLEQFFVIGVNNETNERIFSLTNAISPFFYEKNAMGYTIFIFGWNEGEPKTVNWRLEMVRMKHHRTIHLCNTLLNLECSPYGMPAIEINEIKNFYVPNRHRRLCRCTIRIPKRSILTLRLSTSHREVQFVLTISLDSKYGSSDSEDSAPKNSVLVECFSKNGAVLLPSLVLENLQSKGWWNETDEESTVYILEVHILNNSWPLTKREWGIVEPMRVNGETWRESTGSVQSVKKTGSDSRKRMTRASKRSVAEKSVENPFWTLQVLSDSSEGDSSEAMTVEEDRTCYESVKAMKASWEEKNPGRKKRGRDLRMEFLRGIYFESPSMRTKDENFGESEIVGEKSESIESDDFKVLLQKMTSFSYLTNDKSTERYSKSPRVLPWMPTEELVRKYKREWQDSSANSMLNSSGFESDRKRNIAEEEEEERREFLSLCKHYRVIMANHLAEEQNLSNRLTEQATDRRSKAILRMTR